MTWYNVAYIMAAKPSPSSPMPGKTSTKKEFLTFISIPVGLILLVFLITFLPSLFARPAYDFIYSYCPSYDCHNNYVVDRDGYLREVNVSQTLSDYPGTTQIYYHDTQKNSSKKIEFAEARTYKLDASNVSKDGYSLSSNGTSDGGFLFWGYSDQDTYYLKKGSFTKSRALNLEINRYDSRAIELIGWVEK